MKLRPARIAAALALAAGAAVAWIAFVGVAVDADALRGPLERTLGDALGRTVRIEAPVAMRVSLHPHAVLRGLAIENPPGFEPREFATVQEVKLAAELLPLLRGEVRIRELRASGVQVRLRRNADGVPNWVFARADAAPRRESPAVMPHLDVHRVALHEARVEMPDGFVIELAELVGAARRGERTHMTARGVIGGREAWSASLDASPLDDLRGTSPWTFDLRGEAGGAALAIAGAVRDPLGTPEVEARIGAGTPDVADTAARFGATAPKLGGVAFGGELHAGAGSVRVEPLNAVFGDSAANGALSLDTTSARPRLSGHLSLARLDLTPFFAASADAQGPPRTLAETFRELERTDIDLRRFAYADADVALDVEEVRGVPGDLREVSVRVRGVADRLELPMKFMLAGARFAGEAVVDVATLPARYRLTLAAGPSPFGGIAEVIFGAPYVDGTIREMRFELASDGEQVIELVERAEFRGRLAGAALTYGNFAGGAPVRMTLDRADLAQPRRGTLGARVRGSLIGRPFDATLQADSLARVIETGSTRLAFAATSGGARASVTGRLAEVTAAAGPDLAVRLTAQRAAELAAWLGFASTSALPVDLRGDVQVRRGGTSLLSARADVGQSSVRGDLVQATVRGRAVMRAVLDAERLHLAELGGLTAPGDRPRGGVVDIPLLPRRLDIGDADLDVRVRRVEGGALRVTEARFAGSLRGGVMPSSPLALQLEGVPLEGAIAADFSGDVPRAQLWLQGRDVNVAKWLQALGVGSSIEATAADLRLYADVRDTTVGRALDVSSVVANIGQGRLVVRDRNTKAAFRLRVEEGELRADPGEPLQATLKGRVFRAPMELKLVTGRLREFVEAKRLPLEVLLTGAGARLVLSGEIAPRVSAPDLNLVVGVTGTTFAELGPLFRASLPPWGPYAGAARVRISSWGYEVEDMRFAVGQSVLEGRGALETARPRPLATVALAATTIQLDDFDLGAWSPFDAPPGQDTRSMAARIGETATETSAQVQALLDPDLLAAYDADLRLDVRQVLSGRDRLGRGRIAAKVEEGALTIDPVEVEVVGGSARMDWSYRPGKESIETRARIKADRFDYGVLARRVRPDTDLAGTFSLDLDVAGASPRLSSAMVRGDGHVDVAVWPERLDASVFDLWATNVFLAVLPALRADVSKVNCAIGELDLNNGVLTSRRVLIDTTNTRAQGSTIADLPGDALEARLVPQPKVPQFFALATPIEVSGTLRDFSVRVRPGDVFATVARWATSLVVVPIRKLTETPPPADGSDVCAPSLRTPR